MVGVIHATVDASVGVVSASIRYPGTSDTIVQQETSRMKEYCKSTTCLREREREKETCAYFESFEKKGKRVFQAKLR